MPLLVVIYHHLPTIICLPNFKCLLHPFHEVYQQIRKLVTEMTSLKVIGNDIGTVRYDYEWFSYDFQLAFRSKMALSHIVS